MKRIYLLAGLVLASSFGAAEAQDNSWMDGVRYRPASYTYSGGSRARKSARYGYGYAQPRYANGGFNDQEITQFFDGVCSVGNLLAFIPKLQAASLACLPSAFMGVARMGQPYYGNGHSNGHAPISYQRPRVRYIRVKVPASERDIDARVEAAIQRKIASGELMSRFSSTPLPADESSRAPRGKQEAPPAVPYGSALRQKPAGAPPPGMRRDLPKAQSVSAKDGEWREYFLEVSLIEEPTSVEEARLGMFSEGLRKHIPSLTAPRVQVRSVYSRKVDPPIKI